MSSSSKRLISTLIGCFGICSVLAVAVFAAPNTPKIVIAETGFNFGEYSETTPLTHDFVVKNSGGTVLNIKDVQPS